MNRRVRCLVATATIGVAVMVAAPARACTTLDLGCTTDALTDDVGGAVDEATDVAGETLGPAGDPLDGVIDGTVEDVTGAIDGVVGGTPDLPTDPGGPGPPDADDPTRGDGPTDPRNDRGFERPDRDAPSPITIVGAAASRAARLTASRPPVVAAAAALSRRPSPGHDPGGVAGALLEAAPSLAVLAALLGLALAFASAQAAIDRRDPRLAAVRASDEVVRFR